MSAVSGKESQVEEFAAVLDRIERVGQELPHLQKSIGGFIAAGALLGIEIIDRGGRGLPIALRRYQSVLVSETADVLEHLLGLERAGIAAARSPRIEAMLVSRREELLNLLMSGRNMDLINVAPSLGIDLSRAEFDPDIALREFRRRVTRAPAQPLRGAEPDGAGVFADYAAADLPPEERERKAARIATTPELKGHSHDELIVLAKLRDLVMRIDRYGFGVAPRRRAMFSKARRNLLWSIPRLALVMATHAPTWRRQPAISAILTDLRRYEGHMIDLAQVPEDDDWFTRKDPLIRAIHRDARRAHALAVSVLMDISEGPSAYRFPRTVFGAPPLRSTNYADQLFDQAAPLFNALLTAGIGGRGERERALRATEQGSGQKDREAGSILSPLRSLFSGPQG